MPPGRIFQRGFLLARFRPLTWCCGLLFAGMAVAGWIKLRYGFNFMDEGMFMADGWRLSSGDRLFPDSRINAVMMYAIFNAAVFKVFPGVTLLGFRELQQLLALLAITLFAAAAYRWTGRLWLILLALSVFAFTGLDVVGANANLSYLTYPHLFFLLHLSLLLFALDSRRPVVRPAFFVASGVSLWAVGFSFLPLASAMAIPVATWLAMRHMGWREEFTRREMLLVIGPGLALWAAFLAVCGHEFVPALLDIYHYIKEGGVESGFDRVPLQYVGVTAVFATVLVSISHLSLPVFFRMGALTVMMMFIIANTNLFNLVTSFWQGWFPLQMWFCALMMVTMAALLGRLFCRARCGAAFDRTDVLYLVLVLPSALFALLFSQFTVTGVLVVSYVALPVSTALAQFTFTRLQNLRIGEKAAALAVAALLLPFYYNLVRADWEFTFFDLPPKFLTRPLAGGFGEGVYTSEFNHELVAWLVQTAKLHSNEGDFVIVEGQSPMVYMTIRRRPALNHSFTGWASSRSLQRDALGVMVQQGREPKIAYRFLFAPMILPGAASAEKFTLGPRFNYQQSEPLSTYLAGHMRYADAFDFRGRRVVELYVRAPESAAKP